jgi:ribulose-5-phosphate 4-epimerase/fuculose-1-phosphate aldolase
MIEDIIRLGKHASNYCVGMEGNISGIIDTTFMIKSSGTRLSNITKDDLIEYNFKGDKITYTEKKGSMEIGFHKYLLSIEGINYVSHTHPINTLKILCNPSGNVKYNFTNSRFFPDQVIFNGKYSCFVEYATPGAELENVIKNKVSDYINKYNITPKLILLENHGIIACGKSVDECIMITDICEKAAEIYQNNPIKFLSEENIDKLVNDTNEKYRKNLI